MSRKSSDGTERLLELKTADIRLIEDDSGLILRAEDDRQAVEISLTKGQTINLLQDILQRIEIVTDQEVSR